MYSYKFRIYPNKNQERTLRRWAGICRFTYNWLIDQNNNFYDQNKELDKKEYWIKYREFFGAYFTKLLSRAKKTPELSFLSKVPANTLNAVGGNLDLAWKSFYKSRLS